MDRHVIDVDAPDDAPWMIERAGPSRNTRASTSKARAKAGAPPKPRPKAKLPPGDVIELTDSEEEEEEGDGGPRAGPSQQHQKPNPKQSQNHNQNQDGNRNRNQNQIRAGPSQTKRVLLLPPLRVAQARERERERERDRERERERERQMEREWEWERERERQHQREQERERERVEAAIPVERPPVAAHGHGQVLGLGHARLPLFLPDEYDFFGDVPFGLQLPPPQPGVAVAGAVGAAHAPEPEPAPAAVAGAGWVRPQVPEPPQVWVPLGVGAPPQVAAAPAPAQVAMEAAPAVRVVPELLREDPLPRAADAEPSQDDEVPFDVYVAQVLEIIPDVLPAHVFSLIEQHYPNYKDKVVEPVLHTLFENPDYPKAEAKGKAKRKREEDDDDDDEHDGPQRPVKMKIDYGDKNRRREGGLHYVNLALEQLENEFVFVPSAHIRLAFGLNNALYAPTYLELRREQQQVPPPYKPMLRPRNKGKGKRAQRNDDELDREMAWVRQKLVEEEAQRAAAVEEEARMQAEGGIECGCCFSEYPFDKMVQCPEAHLFCTECMLAYAETKLGAHDARIVCMDQGGCKLPFPESELRRFLTPKLLALYERVQQRKEIEAAGLEGLEECPFCEYKVVIENEQERLFRCENEACGAVTCRKCKKPDHLPKSCQEVEDDKKLDVRHAIEEAMTRALMRNCPKCQKAFIKEMGCNKMTCPNCGTISCYVCRKVINGYDHFNQQPPYTQKANPNKCALWDAAGVEGRHSDEVTAAAKQALEEYKRAHPEMDDKDLHVDLPPPPPPVPGPARGAAYVQVPPLGMHHAPPPPHQPGLPDLRGMHALHARAIARHQAQWDVLQGLPPPLMQPPVFNLQVHINHNQPQAGPAYPRAAAVAAAAVAHPPVPVAAARPRVRRSARNRARR